MVGARGAPSAIARLVSPLRIVGSSTLGSQGDVCVRTLLLSRPPDICFRLKHIPAVISTRLWTVIGYYVLRETFRRLNKNGSS